MNFFEKIIYWMQGTMECPPPFGWFHLLWIGLTVGSIILLYNLRHKYSNKQLKTVLLIYGFVALILEVIKQIIWSFNYDSLTGIITWDYQWYAAPFQLCTTPIFVCLISVFMPKNKQRDSLLSYLAFITILGGLMTILLPESCFTKDIEVNIHTMWLHCGSFVVSIYLLMNGEVEIKWKNLTNAFIVFLIFVGIAQILNIGIYHSGLLQGETFNMFYISPYFISSLPIYNVIQENIPYILFLLFYISSIFIGAFVIYVICNFIKKFILKNN